MSGFSFLTTARQALSGHRGWSPFWRRSVGPVPSSASYDAVVVGGGSHGLATAHALLAEQNMRRVAVIEAGWLGGGLATRNAGIIRPGAVWDASSQLYQAALERWANLNQQLDFNVLFSPRGILTLAHDDGDVRALRRLVYANQRQGVPAEWLEPAQAQACCPRLTTSSVRWPLLGGCWQPTGGTVRHDAVIWGYGRALSALGGEIFEQCTAQAIRCDGGRVVGVETSQGFFASERVVLACGNGVAAVAATAGVSLALNQRTIHACVTEPVKPALDPVIVSPGAGLCVHQSDRGELVIVGSGAAGQAPLEAWEALEQNAAALVGLLPSLARLRVVRSWSGSVDETPDGSPVVGEAGVPGLWLSAGWGASGFQATPAVGALLAAQVARRGIPAVLQPFSLDRFQTGALLGERAASVVAY